MLCLVPLVGQTRGEDILNALLVFFDEKKSQLVRSTSMCTDDTPSMRGKKMGLVGLIKKGKKYQTLSVSTASSIRSHWYQNWEIIYSKTWCSCSCGKLNLQSAEPQTVPTTHWGLWHGVWWFTDAQWREMVVPWKSAWTISEPIPWDLHFPGQQRKTGARAGRPMLDHTAVITDITGHLNTLNLKLQGRDKLPNNMLNVIRAVTYLTENSFTSPNSELSPQTTHLCWST